MCLLLRQNIYIAECFDFTRCQQRCQITSQAIASAFECTSKNCLLPIHLAWRGCCCCCGDGFLLTYIHRTRLYTFANSLLHFQYSRLLVIMSMQLSIYYCDDDLLQHATDGVAGKILECSTSSDRRPTISFSCNCRTIHAPTYKCMNLTTISITCVRTGRTVYTAV